MSLWTTPANPDLKLFPNLTQTQIEEALLEIDIREIQEQLKNDEEFQKRLRAFRPRPISVETLLKPID